MIFVYIAAFDWQVKFARMETEEAKQRRITSYEYLEKMRRQEKWVNCKYHASSEEASLTLGEGLYAGNSDQVRLS